MNLSHKLLFNCKGIYASSPSKVNFPSLFDYNNLNINKFLFNKGSYICMILNINQILFQVPATFAASVDRHFVFSVSLLSILFLFGLPF